MSLERVTITGADDWTDINELVALSSEFPFVEWGILVSNTQAGSYRFPSRQWIDRFAAVAAQKRLMVSTHICGHWTRQILVGELKWSDLPACFEVSDRAQINTHAERLKSTTGLFRLLNRCPGKEFIFQWDGVNDHLALAATGYGCKVSALFDKSGGAGILPPSWPPPRMEFLRCGYAGGLGPDNVVTQLLAIERVCNTGWGKPPFWIDMERRVRSADDSRLMIKHVRRVLESVRPYAMQSADLVSRRRCGEECAGK